MSCWYKRSNEAPHEAPNIMKHQAPTSKLQRSSKRQTSNVMVRGGFNLKIEVETGAHAHRTQFSAPSRKTWTHLKVPSVRVNITRNRRTRGRVRRLRVMLT